MNSDSIYNQKCWRLVEKNFMNFVSRYDNSLATTFNDLIIRFDDTNYWDRLGFSRHDMYIIQISSEGKLIKAYSLQEATRIRKLNQL
jgi:hypothetical protein